jgi:hypothetical protein
MSSNYYQGRVDRLVDDLADLEVKVASERDRAAKERAAGLRATGSIRPSTSASTMQSKLKEAQRREEAAVKHDRSVARLMGDIAKKQRAMTAARKQVSAAEGSERRRTSFDSNAGFSAAPIELVPAVPLATDRGNPPGEPVVMRDLGARDLTLADQGVADAALDIATAVALGALSSVPVLGPILREVVGVAWGNNRAERLERFAKELRVRVEILDTKLDHDFVRRDEFHGLAEEALERVVQRRNERKIGSFASAVANSATVDRPPERDRDRFLDWLDQLRPIHIAILERLRNPPDGWKRPPDLATVGQVANSKLAHALIDIDATPLDMLDLQQRGLLRPLDDSQTLLALADDVHMALTPMGIRFLQFIDTEGHPGEEGVASS